jgi:hypothetical protein
MEPGAINVIPWSTTVVMLGFMVFGGWIGYLLLRK